MLLMGLTVDENIIQVGYAKVIGIADKEDLHQILEKTRGVSKTKGHCQIFKQALEGLDALLHLYPYLIRYLFESIFQINLREHFEPENCSERSSALGIWY